MNTNLIIQVSVFFFITALIGFLTYMKCRNSKHGEAGSNKEYFLAGGGLSWVFVAGSITLTNLSTDQLIGSNGNQMLLLAWWELSAVIGLVILAKVFLPIYYEQKCVTTTELLERRYKSPHIRAAISALFLLGNLFIFLPAILYGGPLFMQTMFNIDVPLMVLAVAFAIVGACYAIFGGLRAVAVSDTYSGVGLLTMAVLVVILALVAIDFDFSGIPAERLTLVGANDSPIPWHVLLTGMIFIQTFYWSTNQTITQRAMASPTVKEAQKGVLVAAGIRLLIVPPIIVLPGVVAFKLFGDVDDRAYGMIVAEVLPSWLSGAFAAMMAATVLTTFNSILNSSAALYVCDIHERYISKEKDINVRTVSCWASIIFSLIALAIVPFYAQTESIINTIQEYYGTLSMPILSVFIIGLVFGNIRASIAIATVVGGSSLYGFFITVWAPFHYIHMMFITLVTCVIFAILANKVFYNEWPVLASRLKSSR